MIYKMANMIVRSHAAVQVLIRDATDNIWWNILIFFICHDGRMNIENGVEWAINGENDKIRWSTLSPCL